MYRFRYKFIDEQDKSTALVVILSLYCNAGNCNNVSFCSQGIEGERMKFPNVIVVGDSDDLC